MTEFSDRPFVAGSVVGLRSFAVDELGRLYGPLLGQVFNPGENVAECRKERADSRTWTMPSFQMVFGPPPPHAKVPVSLAVHPASEAEPPAAVEVKQEPPHVLAGVECRCGFYAYFDGSDDYRHKDRVSAIIEGYGVCAVGTRGFRAEKAKLVALVRPPLAVQRNYRDVPMYDKRIEAVVAHPLSTDAVPRPTDADFWTRDPK